MKRQVSYGELAWLGYEFERKLKESGITLCDDDYATEALMDFTSQYEDGNDKPELNLLYPDRMIQTGSVVKFKDIYPTLTFKVIGFVRPGEIISDNEVNESDELVYRLELDKSSEGQMGFEAMFGQASELERL